MLINVHKAPATAAARTIYHNAGLVDVFVSGDLLNMSRNIRITLVMLCLTVVIHLMIYYEKSKQLPRNAIGHLRELLPDHGASEGSLVVPAESIQVNKTSLPSAPPGDGQLYKLIETSKAPFLPGYRKQVLIVAYQRVGSSFFGQLFDSNPSFFYVYEPLDSVYTEMYGTQGGFNVPSDITYLPNGEPRIIPDREKSAIRNLLTDILSCNVDSLPAGFMLHKYWFLLTMSFMPSWHSYRTCLKNHRSLKARESCWEAHLQAICPKRFGINPERQEYCSRKLAGAANHPGHGDPFHRYHHCLASHYEASKPCTHMFKRKCEQATVWATKTVRATMDEVEPLLEQNPNARIIHLIRDPRPVSVSRTTEPSYRGIYAGEIDERAGGDRLREARVYCGSVARDIVRRRTLEAAYPGKTAQVVYEDFVQNPVAYARAVYAFLDERMPATLATWLDEKTNWKGTQQNATTRMNAWKKHLTPSESRKIIEECQQFYELLNYKWPYDDH